MNAQPSDVPAAPDNVGRNEKLLFWASFIALIATAFGFIVRTQVIADWGREFNLSETQKGEIFGVGLWPFAISIVLFSLIIDRIGYGKAMVFAFVCHVASAVITILTPQISGGDPKVAYWVLYIGTFIVALGNGTVEAVVNPVVATLFPREKTKWLNILHAGWPGGLVLGGILAIAMGGIEWQYKVALLFLPVVAYGLLMLGRRFPINERVAAGVSYKAMLQQVGALGALIVSTMIVFEVTRVMSDLGLIFSENAALMSGWGTQVVGDLNGIEVTYALVVKLGIIALLTIGYGVYAQSLGNPLFVFLLLVMIPLATTELGTDSWITSLMEPEMAAKNLNPGWVLVYTSLIMMILRFFAGPIVHRLSPLGLLAMSAAIAAMGLVFLSQAAGLAILLAATLYGFGKTFFWPTMLGVVAEQFPKGGALTLNTIAGVGMLSVGVVGNPFLGNIQDSRVDARLTQQDPSLHSRVTAEEKLSVFGRYKPLDPQKVASLPAAEQGTIKTIQDEEKKSALLTVAILPCIMLACYLGLILYFRSKGGYKPQIPISDAEEELLMTGGAVGPAEM